MSQMAFTKENLMAAATLKLGKDASPKEIEDHITLLQERRAEHMQSAEHIDEHLMGVYERLGATLKMNGKLSDMPKRRNGKSGTGSKGGVRMSAGTGKILTLIRELAKGKPAVALTKDVVRAAKTKLKIKYPHSSFQSLKTAGAIKLKTPHRGMITLV